MRHTRQLAVAAMLVVGCSNPESHVQSASTAVCGDGIVEDNEECDDGNLINTDDCLATCVVAKCGDGVIDVSGVDPEACDDGNTVDGDGCSADCKSTERCGNRIMDPGEACDDGNTTNGTCSDTHAPCNSNLECATGQCRPDGCSSNCKSTEVCGNGIVDLGEVCDDGGAPGGCDTDCMSGVGCGNGVLDIGEECDDGNSINTDDCTTSCRINVCGDGIIDNTGITHHETCDAGVNGVAIETANCNIDCTTPSCGDGKVNAHAGEQCDLGKVNNVNQNSNAKDCTAACKINVCGDGFADTMGPSHIEACDDGNHNDADGCNTICGLPICGNGIRDQGEQCDDGNLLNGDGCSSVCKYE